MKSKIKSIFERLRPIVWPQVSTTASYHAATIASLAVLALLPIIEVMANRAVYDRVLSYDSLASLGALTLIVLLVALIDHQLRRLKARMDDASGEHEERTLFANLMHRIVRGRVDTVLAPHAILQVPGQVEAARELRSSSVTAIKVEVAQAVIMLGLLAYVGGWLVLVPMIVGAALFALVNRIRTAITVTNNNLATSTGHRMRLLNEIADGLVDIKAFRAEETMLGRMQTAVDAAARSAAEMRWLSISAIVMNRSLVRLASWATLALGATLAITTHSVTIGELVVASIICGRALEPILSISGSLIKIARAQAAQEALAKFDTITVEDEAAGLIQLSEKIDGRIDVQDVSYSYPGALVPSVKGISLSIQPGEVVALIGDSGSGKTTLLKLLNKTLEPSSGLITVDDVATAHLQAASIRRHMVLAPQDPVLFSGSIADNIRLGSDASDNQLVQAAALSGTASWIKRKTEGYGTAVVNGGRNFSGGERQSVGLARLYCANPTVALLDEPVAHMDPGMRALWMQGMRQWLRGRTAIIATHQLELLQLCSRVVVMQGGQIIHDMPIQEFIRRLQAQQQPAQAPVAQAAE